MPGGDAGCAAGSSWSASCVGGIGEGAEEVCQFGLDKGKGVALQAVDSGIDGSFVFDEKRVDIGLVDVRGALRLRKRQIEKEEGFDLPIEGEPANKPFGNVFEGDEHADDGPVHRPSLEFWLRVWKAIEGLERRETGQQERKPGAQQMGDQGHKHGGRRLKAVCVELLDVVGA